MTGPRVRSARESAPGEAAVEKYREVTALPFAHLHEASSTLRRSLGRRMLDDGVPGGPDWSTFRVVGPVEVFDEAGFIAYEYRGSVEPRRPAPLPNIRSQAGSS